MVRTMITVTEIERIAGFREPPRQVTIKVPINLELFNKLYSTCIQEGVDIQRKIGEILERALTA